MHVWTPNEGGLYCWKEAIKYFTKILSGENQGDISKRSCRSVSELVKCMMYPVSRLSIVVFLNCIHLSVTPAHAAADDWYWPKWT